MKIITTLFITLISSIQFAFSQGFADKFKKRAKDCADAAKKMASDTVEGAKSFSESEIKEQLKSLPEQASDLAKQIAGMGSSTADFSKTFTRSILFGVPGALARIWRFDSSLKHVKTHMVIPLVAIMRGIRKNQDNPEELAKILARMTLLLGETEVKITRMVATEIGQISLAPLGLITIPVVNDVTPKGFVSVINSVILGRIKTVLFSKELSFKQRIDAFLDLETAMDELVMKFREATGWDELEEEILQWEAENLIKESPIDEIQEE